MPQPSCTSIFDYEWWCSLWCSLVEESSSVLVTVKKVWDYCYINHLKKSLWLLEKVQKLKESLPESSVGEISITLNRVWLHIPKFTTSIYPKATNMKALKVIRESNKRQWFRGAESNAVNVMLIPIENIQLAFTCVFILFWATQNSFFLFQFYILYIFLHRVPLWALPKMLGT